MVKTGRGPSPRAIACSRCSRSSSSQNDARARLGFSYTQAGKFADAEREYRQVIKDIPKGDTLSGQMTQNIGEVIWRMAENAEKANKVDSAVYHLPPHCA